MRKISTFEAKNKLGQLLRRAEQGEEIPIARHGKVVAHLAPPGHAASREVSRAAAQRIRARAEERRLGTFDWTEWKAFRDEGRP